MSLTASFVLRLVSSTLQDMEDGIEKRWPWENGSDDTIGLLDYLNDAIRAVATQRPDCYTVTENIVINPRDIYQKLPQGTNGFCRITNNMIQAGDHFRRGRAVLFAPYETLLSLYNPDNPVVRYIEKNGRYEVDNYSYDRVRDPDHFLIYPQTSNFNSAFLEIVYYKYPPQIESADTEICIPHFYCQALVHHMLSSIFESDNDKSGLEKAEYHRKLFQDAMDNRLRVDITMSQPTYKLPGGV